MLTAKQQKIRKHQAADEWRSAMSRVITVCQILRARILHYQYDAQLRDYLFDIQVSNVFGTWRVQKSRQQFSRFSQELDIVFAAESGGRGRERCLPKMPKDHSFSHIWSSVRGMSRLQEKLAHFLNALLAQPPYISRSRIVLEFLLPSSQDSSQNASQSLVQVPRMEAHQDHCHSISHVLQTPSQNISVNDSPSEPLSLIAAHELQTEQFSLPPPLFLPPPPHTPIPHRHRHSESLPVCKSIHTKSCHSESLSLVTPSRSHSSQLESSPFPHIIYPVRCKVSCGRQVAKIPYDHQCDFETFMKSCKVKLNIEHTLNKLNYQDPNGSNIAVHDKEDLDLAVALMGKALLFTV